MGHLEAAMLVWVKLCWGSRVVAGGLMRWCFWCSLQNTLPTAACRTPLLSPAHLPLPLRACIP